MWFLSIPVVPACERPLSSAELTARVARFDDRLARRDLDGIVRDDADALDALDCAVEVLSPSLVAELLGEHAFAVAESEGWTKAGPWMAASRAAGRPRFLDGIPGTPFAQAWEGTDVPSTATVLGAWDRVLVNGRPILAEGRPHRAPSVVQFVASDRVETRVVDPGTPLPASWSTDADPRKAREHALGLSLGAVGMGAAAAGATLMALSTPDYDARPIERYDEGVRRLGFGAGALATGLLLGGAALYLSF